MHPISDIAGFPALFDTQEDETGEPLSNRLWARLSAPLFYVLKLLR